MLSSQEEFETLVAVEHALERLQSDGSSKYVGRNTSDGCRDFYFYVRAPEQWVAAVDGLMQEFPDYEFERGVRSDPSWTTYFEFLRPSEEDRERIQNRRTCDALERKGEVFEKERPIEHWAYFPSPLSRQTFADAATKLGYTLVALIEPEFDGDTYGIRLSCVGVPSIDRIDDFTLPLFRTALEHGGTYDGWETQVVR